MRGEFLSFIFFFSILLLIFFEKKKEQNFAKSQKKFILDFVI